MKKHLKKICSLLIVLAMLMTLTSIPAFAGNLPQETDTVVVSVENVEANATVTGYKIVKATYGDEGGLTGYELAEGVTIADISAPTEGEIAAIVAAINSGLALETVTFTAGNNGYEAEVHAGSYLVLVTNTNTDMYNPMIVSAGYDDTNTLCAGTVDASGNFETGGTTYYAKKSQPSISKTIVDGATEKGDDLAIGDVRNFKITTTIPDYSSAYEEVTFEIQDTLNGLEYESGLAVKVGGTEISSADAVIETTSNSIHITFDSDFILAHGNEEVEVTYPAKLSEDAGINFDVNTNKAVLTFSTDPQDGTSSKEDKTYHYTFGIDAALGGTSEGKTSKTHEVIKVNEDGTFETVTVNDGIDTTVTEGALADATFKLTNKETGAEYSATTDADGYLSFTGLDAGEYELVETVAPDGYTLNTTVHEVVISADYNPDGTLNSYSVMIDGEATSTYSATYAEGGVITEIKADEQTTVIRNTEIKALPSTGGIGTYIFTIAGIFVMAGAVVMLVLKKKQDNK